MAAATLVVSLLMSLLTFWAVNSIQQDARMNDTRFGRDLGLLLAANVAPLVAQNNRTELARLSEKFYNSTASIRYLLYADTQGEIYFGIPFSAVEVQNSLTLRRRIQLPELAAPDQPFVRQHLTPDGLIADVFVPLLQNEKYLGILALGINPNPTVLSASLLTRNITLAVFISIWILVILGGLFNAVTITRPIRELLVGVKNITSGDFRQRIDLPFGGELGELIVSFNEMAERLAHYEEQNIEELTTQKAKLDTLMSTIADGAILLDCELKIVLINPIAEKIFGWSGQDVLGQEAFIALPKPVAETLAQPLVDLTQHGEANGEPEEFCIHIQSPYKCTVKILLTTVFDHLRNQLQGIAITVQDVTREMELNEAKSHFISNVSHELRTPLFNIKSFIETLYEYGHSLSEEQKRDFLETANKETDRLTRLVNDVLDISRLESGKPYPLTPTALSAVVEQTLRAHRLTAKDKEIYLSAVMEPDLPDVIGHYDLLLQVLANLVGNALKFTPAGGHVILWAYPWAGRVRVEVSDTGIGIPSEHQDAIFGRFFRVENRVHTLEGTGLGLSIVQNILQKHHTDIQLLSEVGIGSSFWFDLDQA
ncbi:PAS/PAC sensor signal transduction histidine kinase [Gloeomargarita lithophora Alchichica-D10]|uniref:histidine kinase n=2 Tax=Gloeomargarita TaxID=1188227 RepID=A0A1J0ADN6_9CYAN|nr:PAS/PAC sensor signal transduction histidine kinase [Gloeomargarita lithophora Alchichica-D10]